MLARQMRAKASNSIVVGLIGASLFTAVGCKSVPTPEDYARERTQVAESFYQSDRPLAAFEQLGADLTSAGPVSEPAKKFVANHQDFSQKLVADLDSRTQSPKDKEEIFRSIRVLKSAKQANLVQPTDYDRLMTQADVASVSGNATDRFDFVLSDTLDDLPGLHTPDAQKIIFDRSLRVLTSDNRFKGSALTREIFSYIAQRGSKSPEYAALKAALPKLELGRADLEESVGKVFPDYAKTALANRTINVALQFDPADRLLEDDVKSALTTRSRAINLVPPSQKADVVITIGKLRYDERTLPERRDTVIIAQYQVNMLAAVLLMPQNASYLYDYTTGGAEIEYAFSVKAVQGKNTISDDVLRSTVSRSYGSCSNYRIQNVFGGVQPANFVANDQMQARCSGSGSVVRPSDLRREVIDALTAKIAAVPPIEKMIALGS